MLEIFDKSRKRIAIAENASGVEEERKINSLWYLTFFASVQRREK